MRWLEWKYKTFQMLNPKLNILWLDLIENVFTACAGDVDNDQNIDQLKEWSCCLKFWNNYDSFINYYSSGIKLKLTWCLGRDWTGNLFQMISLGFLFWFAIKRVLNYGQFLWQSLGSEIVLIFLLWLIGQSVIFFASFSALIILKPTVAALSQSNKNY